MGGKGWVLISFVPVAVRMLFVTNLVNPASCDIFYYVCLVTFPSSTLPNGNGCVYGHN